MASTVTNTGLKAAVDALVADDVVKYVGWGTGTGGVATSTDLITAAAEARTAGTMSAQTTNTTDDTLRVIALVTATGARAITEVGIFGALTGAVLRMYADFSVLNLLSGDSITFTIDTVFDQG